MLPFLVGQFFFFIALFASFSYGFNNGCLISQTANKKYNKNENEMMFSSTASALFLKCTRYDFIKNNNSKKQASVGAITTTTLVRNMKLTEMMTTRKTITTTAISSVSSSAAIIAMEHHQQSKKNIFFDKQQQQKREQEHSIEHGNKHAKKAITLYDVLGVTNEVTQKELKHAYFALARQTHPDATIVKQNSLSSSSPSSASCSNDFCEITKAYKTLSNAKTRIQYDRKLQAEIISNNLQQVSDTIIENLIPAIYNIVDNIALPMLNSLHDTFIELYRNWIESNNGSGDIVFGVTTANNNNKIRHKNNNPRTGAKNAFFL